MKIKIYRIENEHGIGPFAKEYFDHTEHQEFYDKVFWPKLKKFYHQQHLPNLKEDNLNLTDDHLTGCLAVNDFNHWFSREFLMDLDSMDFAISCYEVDSDYLYVGKTNKQVVFDKDHMKLLNTLPLKSLYNAHENLDVRSVSAGLPKVYLAGPTVFFKNVHEISEEMKAKCRKLGFEPLFPMDNKIDLERKDAPKQIEQSNVALLQIADAVLADVSPFRGTAMDVGTAFEIGMAKQRKLPVVAYMLKRELPYAERVVASDHKAGEDENSVLRDGDGDAIENFDLYENLMIASGTPLEIGFDNALKRLKKSYFPEKITKKKFKVKK